MASFQLHSTGRPRKFVHIFRVDGEVVLLTEETWTPTGDGVNAEVTEVSIWIHPDWTDDEAQCLVHDSLRD